jgi:hypothetical protein
MHILVEQKKSGMHVSKATAQHNTKQYMNCTLPLLHLAISGALSGSKTVHSASFTAFKKT